MGTATLRKCVRDTRHSKPDWTGIRDDQNATASGARPQRVRCHPKHTGAVKPQRRPRRKLPYEEIRRLHEQGLTGVAIAKQLGLKRRGVNNALRKMGLGTGRHKHKRDVLPDGKVRCSICHESKEASEFRDGYSYCRSCGYAQMARQSNNDLDKAIHIRKVWIRNRANRLHIGFDLTGQQLAELYVIQCGRCAYCGKPMVMKLGAGRSERSASIERIIPHKQGGTYTLKNVVWVHFGCNCRRQALAGERLKQRFPEASKAIEQVALERQLELPFPTDSEINVTNDPEPQPAAA